MAKTATYCLFAGNASLRKPRTLSSLNLNTSGCYAAPRPIQALPTSISTSSTHPVTSLPAHSSHTAGRFRDQKELSYAYTGRARSGAPQPPAQFAHLSARCASREPFHDGDLFCGAVSSLWITLCYLGHGAGRAVGQETGVNMRRAVKKEGRTCKKRSWWTDEQTTSEKSR